MEESKYVTSAEQEVVDSKLTDCNIDQYGLNDPFYGYVNSNIEQIQHQSRVEEEESSYVTFGKGETNDIGYEDVFFDLKEVPFVFNKTFSFLENYSNSLQKWKGFITSISHDSFTAELEDLVDQGTKEVATFSKDDVSPDDFSLLKIGATFYWNIGYEIVNGQVKKESIIRFQRIVNWSEEEWYSALDRADDLLNGLRVE